MMTNQNNAAQAAILRRLNQIHADAGYLFGRAAADGACAGAMAESVRTKIDEVKVLLSKLRAPVSSIREGFELTYAADADDPACASDLSHFTNGWRACLMSKLRAPVADERAAFEANFPVPVHCQWIGNGYASTDYNAWDAIKHKTRWEGWQARAALASAPTPVSDESPMAKMADALREKARQEQQAYQDRRNQATEWGPMPDGTEAGHPIPTAPVAHVAGDETSRYLEWAKDRSAWEMPVGTPVYYSALASAPVADAQTFEQWWPLESHRRKYPNDHPVYLAAREAWEAKRQANAPVAGEAQEPVAVVGTDFDLYWAGSGAIAPIVKRHGLKVGSPLYAKPQARPSDDKLWDQTLTERDEYHDMADKLANAIADHLLVDIGEHSSSNCPWMRALEAIESAAPQASADSERVQELENALSAAICRANSAEAMWHKYRDTASAKYIYDTATGTATPQVSAGDVHNAALEEAAAAVEDHQREGRQWIPESLWDRLSREAAGRIRALKQPQADKDGGQQRACTCHPDDRPAEDCQKQYAAAECQQRADESAVRRALAAASNYIDKLGGDSKSYRAALSATPAGQGDSKP